MKKYAFGKLSLLLLLSTAAMACGGGNSNTAPEQTPASNAALTADGPSVPADNTGNAGAPIQGLPEGFYNLPLTEHFSYVGQQFIHVYGTVKNTSGQWIANVRLLVDLYDDQGKKLHAANFMEDEFRSEASDDVICEITCIPPGAEIPFEYLRDVARVNGKYARHSIRAVGKQGEKAETVSLSNISVQQDGSYQAFSGTAKVSGHCKWPNVAAVGYDAGGKIVNLRTYSIYYKPGAQAQDPSYEEMKSGQTGYFNGNMDNPTDDNNKVLAQIATVKFIGYYSCESE